MRCFIGKYYVWWTAKNNNNSWQGDGRAEIDFGSSPGTSTASVAVTGLGSIAASGSTKVEAWMDSDEATSDGKSAATVREASPYIKLDTGSVSAGTGFTIYARGWDFGEVTPPGGITTPSGSSINVNVDKTIYTVPTAPTGKSKFVCNGVEGIITTALVGGPTITMSVGLTAGGQDFWPNSTITSSTAAGTKYGFTLATLGTSFISTDGYNAYLSAADSIIVRLAISNTSSISTPLVITWTVTGFWI